MDTRLRLLNNLYCFEACARNQSYSKAAQELYISQAAVSQQMRSLERNLKVQLFVRHKRTMLLTSEGERLFDACKNGFDLLKQGLNSVMQQGVAGELTITSTQAFCAMWIMPNLYDFAQHNPEINVKVLGSNQLEDLQQKHIDLAIRFSNAATRFNCDHLHVECIGQDVIMPVCSSALAEKHAFERPKDLLKCHLISLADTSITWRAWFEQVGITGIESHSLKTEVTSSDLALSAVLSGHGVMFAPETMIKPYIERGELCIPFNISHPVSWNTCLVYPKNSSKLARIEVFCNWIKNKLYAS